VSSSNNRKRSSPLKDSLVRTSVFVLALLVAAASFAHTKIKATTPENETTVAAPRSLALTFEGDVRLTSVTLSDSAGAEKHVDALPDAVGSRFELAIHDALAPGKYRVVWRAVGGDTHIVSGEFGFTVSAP
jgi:methionine-rich copper-binding protein CopC